MTMTDETATNDQLTMELFLRSFLIVTTTTLSNSLIPGWDPFETWTLSDSVLPIASQSPAALHNSSWNANNIYILGGSECRTCVYIYFIGNDSLEYYDTLDNGCWSYGQTYAVMINNIVYCLNYDGNLWKYNIETKTQSQNALITISSLHGCMTKHPQNEELYFVGGSVSGTYSKQFYIYNFSSNTYYRGNDLNYARYCQNCIVSDYYEKYPYLYIFGGDSVYIERLAIFNVDDSLTNKWELLVTNFENVWNDGSSFAFGTMIRHFGIAQVSNYILLMNGHDGTTGDGEEEAFLFDVITLDLHYIGTTIPDIATCIVYIDVNNVNRVYRFGGMNYVSRSRWIMDDSIYYSNQVFEDTSMPSLIPSLMPSTMPSGVPSGVPTMTGSVMSNMTSIEPSEVASGSLNDSQHVASSEAIETTVNNGHGNDSVSNSSTICDDVTQLVIICSTVLISCIISWISIVKICSIVSSKQGHVPVSTVELSPQNSNVGSQMNNGNHGNDSIGGNGNVNENKESMNEITRIANNKKESEREDESQSESSNRVFAMTTGESLVDGSDKHDGNNNNNVNYGNNGNNGEASDDNDVDVDLLYEEHSRQT